MAEIIINGGEGLRAWKKLYKKHQKMTEIHV